ncbi:helix-turn-helix domain-containing protein [Paenibacillus sp. L3-i20]|uniref:helix-turn-helix domain-containing protein n=1 Tax=Paenibacillus sp. L3-i20 TaxID=2905833 RepID=UPI001EDFD080|nr:helix-turn-helix domain-containing protein [Paenibacillus sp. L3-i20]GKU78025.1 AraC family transcriptional regulator [Paenibacillus sp. L3-i20]
MIDVNELAGHFAKNVLTLHGVFHAVLSPNNTFYPYTAIRPIPTAGFVFVVRGCGLFIFNETTYELNAGMVVHGSKGMSLTMQTGQSELEYYLVRYSNSNDLTMNEHSTSDFLQSHFVIEPALSPQITELIRQLHESYYTSGNMALLRSNYLFNTILHETFSNYLNNLQGKSKHICERAKVYIHNHYMDELSLQKLAEQHGITSKAFSYLFHKYTGVSPIQYVIQHRMKRAEELLTTSNFTIKQVAASVGYDDALYFSRLYKKHYGYAPSLALRN